MKTRPILLLSLLLISILSCKKDETSPVTNNGLVGKWKLTEFLTDHGTGISHYVKADENASSLIEFRENGDFKEVKGPIYSSINPYDRYQILPDNRFKLTVKMPSATPIDAIWSYTELTATTLTLNYGCFEACAGKYIAVK